MRIDGAAYSILGMPSYRLNQYQLNASDANVTNRVMTPTQITLIAQAGPMQVNVSFFNPVEVRSKHSNSLNLDSVFSAKGLGQAINTFLIPLHFGKVA